MRRALTAGAVAVALFAAATPNASAAAGCTAGEPFEVCFNDPTGDAASQNLLVTRLRQYIAAAGRGDHIRVAMYSWTLDGIAAELARAKKRRADVRVVVDKSSASKTPVRRLRKAKIPVTVCRGSCTSGRGINHVKLFLFNVGGVRDVVVTSSNLTGKQRSALFNDLIRVRDDARLYAFYASYWRRLNAHSWRGWGDAQREAQGDRGTRGYAFQRTDGDTVARILDGVTGCRKDDKKIWMAMALFSRARAAVQQRLQRLDAMGCNVKLIIGPKVGRAFASRGLKASKVRTRSIHHKLLLIDARYEGRWQEVVFTGSHNLTGPALTTNDEIWLRVENPFVFGAYRAHYDQLWGQTP